jgi:uncharacterized protein (TIRG00374 family)
LSQFASLLRSPRVWLGFALSIVFIAIFILRTDFGEIGDAFADANYWWALASIPVYFAGSWFRAWRWRYLLRPLGDFSTAALFPIVIIGFMANNLIPARAGEFVRAYILGERERVSKMAALGTIAVDRIFDGIVLLLFLLVAGAIAGTNDQLRTIAVSMTILFGAVLAFLAALALSEGFSRWSIHLALRFTPARLRPQVEGLAASFVVGLHSLRSPLDMLAAFLISLVSWLLEATMYFMVGLAFGLDLGFEVYLLITAGANLAISVLATQGGVGPFELVTRETAAYFGASSGAASAYAVALHALVLIPVIAVGLYFLWAINLSLGEALRGRPAAVEAPPGMPGEASAGFTGEEVGQG